MSDEQPKMLPTAESSTELVEVVDDDSGDRSGSTSAHGQRSAGIEVGTWWWLDVDWSDNGDEDAKAVPTLVCITHIGSNYVEVTTLRTQREVYYVGSECSWRIHFDKFWSKLRPAPDAAAHIQRELRHSQNLIREYTAEVQRLAASLVVSPMTALPGHPPDLQDSSALVVASSADPKAYGAELVKAKQETLPALYKKIEVEHKVASAWLLMPTVATKAQLLPQKKLIEAIEDRIFSVQLYAGMTEDLVQIQEGAPAANDTPVHIMQRRAYMDEESLCDYDAGGLDFTDISKFDQWLARPRNLQRLLPFDRCVLAVRVRRSDKEYAARTLWDFIQTIVSNEANRLTYLYLRNGEQLYRLSTDVQFDELLFPDADKETLTSQQLWVDLDNKSVISDAEYKGRIADYEAKCAAELAAYKAKRRATLRRAFEEWRLIGSGPHASNVREYVNRQIFRACGSRPHWFCFDDPRRRYTSFTPAEVKYDDMAAHVAKELKAHNRIILILQGLLDRSPAFQPHPPWQIFTDAGFAQGVRYVYDHYHAVTAGPPPDFEAYRARLNRSLRPGSVCVGQQAAWEAAKDAKQKDAKQHGEKRWNYNDWHNPDHGPGLIARVARTIRGKAVFTWQRKMQRYRNDRWRATETRIVEKKFVASPSQILCIDDYQPGDYRQFFLDPRTRAQYLKWAPLLLIAEEYKAGLRTLETQDDDDDTSPPDEEDEEDEENEENTDGRGQ